MLELPADITTRGAAVRWARMRLEWSQERTSERARVSQGTISDLESGRANAARSCLGRIANDLGLTEAQLRGLPEGPAKVLGYSKGRAPAGGVLLTPEEAAARPTKHPRRCGFCNRVGHLTVECKLAGRRRNHFCTTCCGLPWQRPAEGCPECRQPYGEEEPVGLDVSGAVGSSGGMCVDAAPFGKDDAA